MAALAYMQLLSSLYMQLLSSLYPFCLHPQEKLESPWHAAKHYETCGEICKKSGDWERVAVFFRRASDSYREAGKGSTGEEYWV